MTDDTGIAVTRRTAIVGSAAVIVATSTPALAEPSSSTMLHPGRDQPLDRDWRFFLGEAVHAQNPAYDDGPWRRIDLPHDWSIEALTDQAPPDRVGPFDKTALGGGSTGFTVGGEGWYRKRFRTDAIPDDAHVELAFEGIAVLSDVWVNGMLLGSQVHAYAPFAVDLTPHLLRDRDNVIAVRVRNQGRNSRWYAGSGIYRPVTITVVPAAARFARHGVATWIRRIADDRAELDIMVEVAAHAPGITIRSVLRDATGRIAAEVETPAVAVTRQTVSVRLPHLWSVDAPYLYRLETNLVEQGRVRDRIDQDVGLRIVTMDAHRGLLLNGMRVVLRGGCIHHDNGILGACSYADAEDRRVRLLKARGFNAIRSAHNPASAALRRACDRQGMLLIEEAFDAWHVGKLPEDYARYFRDHWLEHLTAMVRAARGHACVIMWSIGNEIPDRSTPAGVEWSWKLSNAVRAIDPTRPVTAGLNQWIGHPMVAAQGTARAGRAGQMDRASTLFLDVAEYNYRLDEIAADHTEDPERVIYGSETFAKDAYDYAALARRVPYMLGEFVWTAMDYIGETGIGVATYGTGPAPIYPAIGFPHVGAFCGDIDLIGDQKPQSLARDVIWGRSPVEIAVRRPLPDGQDEWLAPWGWSDELPQWTWPGMEGRLLRIRVHAAGDRITLHLNGAQIASRLLSDADRMRAEFDVPYAPGTLEAAAWQGSREIGRRTLATTGPATALRLHAERETLRRTRDSLGFLRIAVVDAAGRALADDSRRVRIAIDGPAELIAFGAGGSCAVASFQSPEATTWHGRALAIVRATGQPGTVRLEARADGVRGAAASLHVV